jgi:lipid II:glycine glycyltransferase (peptidoglycan interpeptide bridge formation enzyme)
MASFLQSDAWQEFQQALGRTTLTDTGENWSYLAIKETGTLNSRLYTPYGPVCADEAGFEAALDSLKKQAATQRCTFIRVEPQTGTTPEQLRHYGFRPVTYQQLQPAHTQIINLTPSSDELLAAMSQNSRNITRNYFKKGVTIRTSQDPADISILTSLLARVAARNHITPHSAEYFRTQAESLMLRNAATLYIADYEDTPIAVAFVFDSKDTRTYAHAAADDTYRKLNAGTAIVGQMILDAKTAGLQFVDLYGIADSDDPHHPWAGFTKFKKSFGGEPITYPGAWDLPLRPLQYWTYRVYQSLRKKLR